MNATSRPWYRHPMVWLVIAPPLGAVIAGFLTLFLVLTHPDPVLDTAPVAPLHAPGEPAHGRLSSSVMPPTD
jgi:hypothetical protein